MHIGDITGIVDRRPSDGHVGSRHETDSIAAYLAEVIGLVPTATLRKVSARSRNQRLAPERPDLPDEFDAAPNSIDSGASWTGLVADASLQVPKVVFDLEMVECVWRNVDATAATLKGLVCRDVVFEGCDFSGAVLDGAAVTRAQFIGCRLTGAIFSGAELNDVVVEGGIANLTNFRMSRSSFLWVQDTSLTDADFYGAHLRRGALLDCDLTGVNLSAAHIDGLCLHGSTLESIRGAAALTDAGVGIDAGQVVPFGVALLGGMGVRVGDRPARL